MNGWVAPAIAGLLAALLLLVAFGTITSSEPPAPRVPSAEAAAPTNAQLARSFNSSLNVTRRTNHLGHLSRSALLVRAARSACALNAGRPDLTHDGFEYRARVTGYRVVTESVAYRTDRSFAEVLRQFLNSPPHRANLLLPIASTVGTVTCRSGRRQIWAVITGRRTLPVGIIPNKLIP